MRLKVEHIIIALFAVIYFQNAFVLSIGAVFKMYDLLSIVLLVFWLVRGKYIIPKGVTLAAFLLFVVSPILSYLFSLVYDYNGFVSKYGDLISLKSTPYIGSLFVMIFYILTWVALAFVISNKYVFQKRDALLKVFVIMGSVVAIYSLYGSFAVNLLGFPDIVPSFLDNRNFPPSKAFRATGFSNEPGSYILMQGWNILILFFKKDLFQKKWRTSLLGLHLIVALLTMSSNIISIFAVYIIWAFANKKVLQLSILGGVFTLFLLYLAAYIDIGYILFDKVVLFLSEPTQITSSGEFRSYTTRIGFDIFSDYPIFGVGPGSSPMHMYKYQFDYGIQIWGESISPDSSPQNGYSQLLSEFGLFGFASFIAFIFFYFKNAVHIKNASHKSIAIYGMIMTLIFLNAFYPLYTLFLWLIPALFMNIALHQNEEIKKNSY